MSGDSTSRSNSKPALKEINGSGQEGGGISELLDDVSDFVPPVVEG